MNFSDWSFPRSWASHRYGLQPALCLKWKWLSCFFKTQKKFHALVRTALSSWQTRISSIDVVMIGLLPYDNMKAHCRWKPARSISTTQKVASMTSLAGLKHVLQVLVYKMHGANFLDKVRCLYQRVLRGTSSTRNSSAALQAYTSIMSALRCH